MLSTSREWVANMGGKLLCSSSEFGQERVINSFLDQNSRIGGTDLARVEADDVHLSYEEPK